MVARGAGAISAADLAPVYKLLSTALLRRPDGRLLGALGRLRADAGILASLPDDAASALRDLSRTEEADLDIVIQDFNDLFRVPLRPPQGKFVPALESVYGEPTGGDEVPLPARLRAIYEKAAFEIPPEVIEPPDHLGVELAFVACLCAREAEAPPGEAGVLGEVRRRFLSEHPGRWADRCCREIARNAATLFYRAVATLIPALLARSQ